MRTLSTHAAWNSSVNAWQPSVQRPWPDTQFATETDARTSTRARTHARTHTHRHTHTHTHKTCAVGVVCRTAGFKTIPNSKIQHSRNSIMRWIYVTVIIEYIKNKIPVDILLTVQKKQGHIPGGTNLVWWPCLAKAHWVKNNSFGSIVRVMDLKVLDAIVPHLFCVMCYWEFLSDCFSTKNNKTKNKYHNGKHAVITWRTWVCLQL